MERSDMSEANSPKGVATALRDALQRLARARGYTSPDLIIAAWDHRTKRTRPILWWTNQ